MRKYFKFGCVFCGMFIIAAHAQEAHSFSLSKLFYRSDRDPSFFQYDYKATDRNRPYETYVNKVAKENNIPSDLVHAVIRTESNYNAKARGSVGEIGLMQVRLATARSLGYSGSARGLYDPAVNMRYGTKYLAMAHRMTDGNTCQTILKYNAGHGAKRMNPISARYCQKVKAYLATLN